MPTGRKQFPGHRELSWFAKISWSAVLLSRLSTGSPFASKRTRPILYPTGESLSQEPWKVIQASAPLSSRIRGCAGDINAGKDQNR
jgi:hypothetical protein